MSIIFLVLAAICLVYYIALVSYSGTATPFSEAWLIAVIGCVLVAIAFKVTVIRDFLIGIPRVVKIVFFSVISLGVILFLVLLINVLSGFNEYPKNDVDCVIVLGAKMRGNTVSRALADRLNKAYEYATEEGNEDVILVVSGGQGKDESMTEAEGMKRYLVEKGLDESRILLEDKSINTKQNLEFSYNIIKEELGENAKLAICTNNFHVFRAVQLAKNMEIENVCGIAAPTKPILVPNSTVRECLALVKEWMIGNISIK